jgi:hypothetical protein
VGAFGLYGGSVRNISKKMKRLFDNALFPPTAGAATPSSAVASVHTIKVYLLNMTIKDPDTGATRTVMLMWDETNWYVASQASTMAYIGTQVVASKYTAWGTDGNKLYPLFQTPSATLQKSLYSKLFGANSFPSFKQGSGFWMMAEDVSSGNSGITINAAIESEYLTTTLEASPFSFNGLPQVSSDTEGIYGTQMALNMTSQSQDFVVRHIMLGYIPTWGGWGSIPDGLAEALDG